MKIKDVEKLLEIPKSTIRYYEQYGLINIMRNDNNERIYTKADIERLKQIKELRTYGFKMQVIKELLTKPKDEKKKVLIREKKRILLSIGEEELTLRVIDNELLKMAQKDSVSEKKE